MNSVSTCQETFEIVRIAWTQTLPRSPFHANLSWADSGADSMKSLQLLMRLEEALGRKLSFDLLHPEMTAAELARTLAGGVAIGTESVPLVYLVPGLYGDAPALSRLRAAMGDTVRFQLVDLPGMELPVSVHASMTAMAKFIADDIERRAPDGEIALAGYSFGGTVAFEAATHLVTRGRHVALLGLLDTIVWHEVHSVDAHELVAEAHPARALPQNLRVPTRRKRLPLGRFRRLAQEQWMRYAERVAFGILVRARLLEPARRLARSRAATSEQQIWRMKAVLGLSRQKALKHWKPSPQDTPTLLLVSAAGLDWEMPIKWQALCSRLRVVNVPTRHMDFLSPPTFETIRTELSAALADVAANTWSPT